jgi:anti-sigma regulatory factor (Ser/Thr protein kinase)
MTPANPARLKLSIPAELKEVRRSSSSIAAFLREQRCLPEEVNACQLALTEACNNAIIHCRELPPEPCVIVEVACTKHEIELRITDRTAGFEWPASASLPEVESETGRGVFLIQAVMDYTSYTRGAGENLLILRKKRRPLSA